MDIYMGKIWMQWLLLLTTMTTIHAQCPVQRPCQCEYASGKHIINCRNKNLNSIPLITASDTTYYELTLARNDITVIPANAFSGIKIERLDMSDNKVASISDQAFTGLENYVKELLLSTDQMAQFPSTALNVLTNLELLDLSKFDLASFPSNGLSSLSNLKEFQLTHSSLEHLPSDMFNSQITTLEKLILSDNALSSIPTAAIDDLQVLGNMSLVANNIRTIPGNTFVTMNSIQSLDISQNGISSIDANAFVGLEDKLQSLFMKLCQLQVNSLAALKVLSSLQTLDVSDNPDLTNIAPDLFDNLGNLQVISMQDCGIGSISATIFDGLNKLESLNMRGNKLDSIGSLTFRSLDSLSNLDLGQNEMLNSELAPGVFNGIEDTLSKVDLSHTDLQNDKWATIKPLTKLTSLSLGQNSLNEIPEFIFQNMSQLAVLRLDSNGIETVVQRHLHGLQNSLVTLNLDNNSIATLNQCTFHEFTQLNLLTLNLNNNPLHCDCRLGWLLNELKSHPDFETYKWGISWVCKTPSNLEGVEFVKLDISQLQCGPTTTIQPCEDFTPSTTTRITSIAPTAPTSVPVSFRISVTDATTTSISIAWTISMVDNVNGFRVTAEAIGHGNAEIVQQKDKNARNAVFNNLKFDTNYLVCVQALITVEWPITKVCTEVRTMPDPVGKTDEPNILAIGLGCGLGGLVVIVIIIVLVCCLRRRAKTKKKASLPTKPQTPLEGYGSKTFSRHSTGDAVSRGSIGTAHDQDSGVRLADNFSPDEQEQIVRMFVAAGGSMARMASMASMASLGGSLASLSTANRPYAHDMMPQADHYIRTGQEERDDPSKHIYCEIPEDSNYQEIPAEHFYNS